MRVKLGSQSMLYPYPVTLLTSVIDGRKNFMQVGFSGIVNANPGMVALGVAKGHFTTMALKEGKVIGLSLANEAMMLKADYVGIRSGSKVDKSEVFKTFTGDYGAELIEEAPINLELQIIKVLDLGGVDNIIISEVKEVHALESVITGKFPDIKKMNPIVFSMNENKYFTIGDQVGRGWRDGLQYETIKAFVEGIFNDFDVLADVENFLPYVVESSKFNFNGQAYVGIEGFKAWYSQVNDLLLQDGMTHIVSGFDAKKIDDKTFEAEFYVRFKATTKSGQDLDDRVKERWLLRQENDSFIIENYQTEIIK